LIEAPELLKTSGLLACKKRKCKLSTLPSLI